MVLRGTSNTARCVSWARGDGSSLGATGFLSSNGKDASNGAVVVLTDTAFSKAILFFFFLESRPRSTRAVAACSGCSVAACVLEK